MGNGRESSLTKSYNKGGVKAFDIYWYHTIDLIVAAQTLTGET